MFDVRRVSATLVALRIGEGLSQSGAVFSINLGKLSTVEKKGILGGLAHHRYPLNEIN